MASNATFMIGWYAIVPSAHVKAKKPKRLIRFGLPLVLWRTQKGKIVIMHDSCPHRGGQLSLGRIGNNQLRCPYHGYQFNADGSCGYAPEFDSKLPGLHVGTYPAKEAFGMIWMQLGNETPFKFAALAALHQHFNGRYSQTERQWHSHITYCIENQLDYTHLRFVHHNTIGKGFSMPSKPKHQCTESAIHIFLREETPALSYYFPNTWVLNISEKMKVLIFFAPIDETNTQLYLRTYRQWLNFPGLKPIVDAIMTLSNRMILRQDERVVRSQGLLPSYTAEHDTLMYHDNAIKFFRKTWKAKLMS